MKKHCKDCKFNTKGRCSSGKVCEDYGNENTNDQLIYDYNEGGGFSVGDYFGCVHFEENKQ